jgi:arginine exporter protein ArgO
MNDNIWHKIDANMFRILGLALGVFGVTALVNNNPRDVLMSDYYGLSFLAIFAMTGAYSFFSLIAEFFPSQQRPE